MKKIFFLRGLPDNNQVTAGVHQGKIAFHGFGGANVMQAARFFEQPVQTYEVVFFGEGIDALPSCPERPDVIFNEISDPDTHGIALGRAVEFCSQWQDVPIINHPSAVQLSTRDVVSRHFHSPAAMQVDGLIIPKTIRCQITAPEQVAEIAAREVLAMPLLARVAGQHGGETLVRIDSADDLAPLNALPLDGRDFYLTEFVDFRSSDGLYRKLRIAVVDGQPFLRHYLIFDDWLIHFAQRDFMLDKPELLREEQEAMASFSETVASRIQPVVEAMQQATELQYFGIDANINDSGQVLVFETNANMNLLVSSKQPRTLGTEVVRKLAGAVENMILSMS